MQATPRARGAPRAVALAGLLCLLSAAAVAVAAQEHAHGGGSGVAILADGPAHTGVPARFAVLDLGDDAVPDFHQQNHVRVLLNGATVFETTPDSGHDYDGVLGFDVAFPTHGRYEVQALDDDGDVMASLRGNVESVGASAALMLEGPAAAPALQAQEFRFGYADPQGDAPRDGPVLLELWDGEALVLRTATDAGAALLSFPHPGEFVVRAVARQPAHPPVAALRVAVVPGVPAPPLAPAPSGMDAQPRNAVVESAGPGPYRLYGTYDPWTSVGPAGRIHLAAWVADPATGMPPAEAVTEAQVRDLMTGRVVAAFPAATQRDGLWELAIAQPVGHYALAVTATAGEWQASIEVPFSVLPPTDPTSVGMQVFRASGLDGARAGEPLSLRLEAADESGQPFAHAEVDFQVVAGAIPAGGIGGAGEAGEASEAGAAHGVPMLAGKLHTHGDGAFEATLALPEGEYHLRLAPTPLEPRAVTGYRLEGGQGMAIAFTVATGPGFPGPEPWSEGMQEEQDAPAGGLGVPLLGFLLAGAAMRLRRP